jgi:signal transduction histidine kinase/CheY-like chemotaxis protein
MHELKSFDIIFPREYLRAALTVSLLSVWVLVGLFYYLNRYTKRPYFTIWTAAWLFYALWLTLGITMPADSAPFVVLVLQQWCVAVSAVFLLWGSLSFLESNPSQRQFGWFIGFLLSWSYVGRALVADPFYIELATFTMIGLSSMFAGVSFYRRRRQRHFLAVGMLFLGFFLWGVYLIAYPFSQRFTALLNAEILFSAVLQLFIAVSMIVLVLEEARQIHQQVVQEIEAISSEKRDLQLQILSTEEKCRALFNQASSREELQAAYDELRQTQQSVVQQERLRALGQMASGVAHDINNALSPVLAFSEMLLRKDTTLAANTRKNLEHIRTSAEDIAQIVARMGEFYRRRKGNDLLHLVAINPLVQQVIELTSPAWRDMSQGRGAEIKIHTCFAQSLPELYGNEYELREALTNIVLNAVDALPSGGRITLSTRAVSRAQPGAGHQPTHLLLEISDNGIGMDPTTRQRCLEPFYSTKRERGGSGLGLAMVYGAVERHEGHIQIQSAVNQGTTVQLLLPLREPPKPNAAAAPPSEKKVSPLHLLCIDDEPLLRELLREVLEFYHHSVETADGGQRGLEMFENARCAGQPFDAVITDLGMPGLNGRQVAEHIKANSPRTPIIMLTGWGAMVEERGESAAKVDAVLSKPPRINELVEALTRVTG